MYTNICLDVHVHVDESMFVDVDECRNDPTLCGFMCRNRIGSYECICPRGQMLLADRKSCAGSQMSIKQPYKPVAKAPRPVTLVYMCPHMLTDICFWFNLNRISQRPQP